MQHAWPISGTFGGETLALAACNAVLDEYACSRAIARIWAAGQRLIDAVNGVTMRLALPARMVGYAARPALRWTLSPELEPVIVALFQQELAQNNVLAHPSGWNPSAAHDAHALESTLAGVTQALTCVAAALQSPEPRLFLRGELLTAPFARAEVKA
jgi:glutamate-1-semialdehyde aminotransferase